MSTAGERRLRTSTHSTPLMAVSPQTAFPVYPATEFATLSRRVTSVLSVEGSALRFDAGGAGPIQPELSLVTGSDGQNSRRHGSLNILVYVLDTFDNVLFH